MPAEPPRGDEAGDRGPGRSLDYRSAGVDLEAAERATRSLSRLVASTQDENTIPGPGLFGGLYALPEGLRDPVLVSSADGVGTKLRLAFRTGRHDTVGQDLVNHCVNDVLVQGARPLFFLDYLATGRLEEGVVEEVVSGIAAACRRNGCALLGGETAEMPGFYEPGEYELAGFVVGVVERASLLDGSAVEEGDALVGLASSGLHTNGYSLARRILFDELALEVDSPFPGMEGSVGDVLLQVHRSYRASLLPEVEAGRIHALAHVTGGGIPGNLPRVLPQDLGARVRSGSWEVPPVFRALQAKGGVDEAEMRRTFNMGVGMIAVAPSGEAEGLAERLRHRGEDAWILGEVTAEPGVRFV